MEVVPQLVKDLFNKTSELRAPKTRQREVFEQNRSYENPKDIFMLEILFTPIELLLCRCSPKFVPSFPFGLKQRNLTTTSGYIGAFVKTADWKRLFVSDSE